MKVRFWWNLMRLKHAIKPMQKQIPTRLAKTRAPDTDEEGRKASRHTVALAASASFASVASVANGSFEE